MYLVSVFTSTHSGAFQLVEESAAPTWDAALARRSILERQYPRHAFLIEISEVAA